MTTLEHTAQRCSTDWIEVNRSCLCLPLDRKEIDANIVRRNSIEGLPGLLSARASLFAGTPVFVSQSDASQMQAQITSIEAALALKGFRDHVFERAPSPVMFVQPQSRGVFMAYDFHLTPDGPRLIEINTNAGGAFLVNVLQNSLPLPSSVCCGTDKAWSRDIEKDIVEMFLTEWRLSGRVGRPRTLAIVDEEPAAQYLYPEMLIAQKMFERHGINTIITDPTSLIYDGAHLLHGKTVIDMVYNRLTDFDFCNRNHVALRAALQDGNAVISPAPRHHALYADKRNLVLLGDRERLSSWGLSAQHIDALSDIPETVPVSSNLADEFWRRRRGLFFKPAAGFGSRGVYRGDKLTRRVWNNILAGDYVAQSYVPPPSRAVALDDETTALKFDVRVYTYSGEPMLYAARLYNGQTTNFRTAGGGFAPIIFSKN